MPKRQAAKRRPFHETVVDAIFSAPSLELAFLATLIKATKIPKNHDKIIAAWNERRQAVGWGYEDLGVPEDLLAQKREAAEEVAEKARAKEEAGASPKPGW